jgi:hypothetical protein
MAAMALPEKAIVQPAVTGRRSAWRASLLWIAVSVVGAVVAALAGWQIRTQLTSGGASLSQGLAYAATVVSAVIASGSQWLVLRRFRLDVYWWVPATVVANLINAIIVFPSILNHFIPAPGSVVASEIAILGGALALAAGGLVVGVAQGLVLRPSSGDIAWAWIPATVVGGALAGALTTTVASNFIGLPSIAALSGLTAIGAFLTAATQVAVFVRLIR